MKVGITGGIGSGKTTFCQILMSMGYRVYFADDAAKSLMVTNKELKQSIVEAFGAQSYDAEGKLNRVYLASKVFNNQENLTKLNKLVHPAVQIDFENWINKYSQAKIHFKEAALIFETGSYKMLDATVLITAPVALRIARVQKRDTHRSEREIEAIIAKQMPEEEKVKLANYIIQNDDKSSLLVQCHHLVRNLSGE